MLISCYLFDWKPFGVFFSYLIEIVALLLVFTVLRTLDERKNPKKYIKEQPINNIFIGVLPLIIFQYFMIGWMSNDLNPDENFIKENLIYTKEVLYGAISVLILYALKAAQISNNQERLNTFQDNFLFRVLALSGANILGFVLIKVIGVTSFITVLTLMVMIRIILEVYFIRKMKFI